VHERRLTVTAHTAFIERSNHKDLHKVEVDVTTREPDRGRASWTGTFMSRSADGFMPDERLALTLDNGMKGTARVSETYFDSRAPDATRILITGTSPLV
jgi:hypothetical protein